MFNKVIKCLFYFKISLLPIEAGVIKCFTAQIIYDIEFD